MDQQNPTGSDAGASTPTDPVDRLERFLAAQDDSTGDTSDENAGETEAKETDEPKEDARAKDDEPQITTAQLAAFLGVEESDIDVDDDGMPVFKTKVDGKEGTAKFADIRKSHQLGVHAENRVREAAEREKAADRKLQEAEQAISARQQHLEANLQQINALTAIANEELGREYQSINWAELRQQDPGRAALLEVEFQKRHGRIQSVFQDINMRRAQAQQVAEAQRKANEEQAFATQVRRLTELIPEWKDPATADKERGEIQAWMRRTGVEDVDLTKASQVYLLRKTWQHDTLQQAKPAIEKQVRSAPKLVKPGTAQTADTSNTALLKNLKQQVKQTGGRSPKAVADLLMAKGLA
jgi:hypothetical protein